MSFPAALRDAQIAIEKDYEAVAYNLVRPGQIDFGADALITPWPRQPRVSCLMVTRGEIGVLRHAVECYRRQSWSPRELVVVTDADRAAALEGFLASQAVPEWSVVAAPPGLSLGDLRNMALSRARGDILVQWDDDDLYDPHRVRTAVLALQAADAASAFLERWLIWWPERRLAALSALRIWEGSIAVRREHARPYRAMGRGEDSYPCQAITHGHTTIILQAPLQYVYVITGRNTWDDAHFEKMLSEAAHVFKDAEYEALMDVLDRRMPIQAYAASLLGG